jgi:hypothetical protein
MKLGEKKRNCDKNVVAGYYNKFHENEKNKDKKPNYFLARKKKLGEVNIQFDK